MNVLLGVSGLIFVSAVTPGPNNIAVLRIAGEQGLKATAAAILGVVLGSLALLIVTQAGLDFVAARHEWPRRAITVGGVGYLLYIGASTIYRSVGTTEGALAPARKPLSGAWSLFAFQFANPKAWRSEEHTSELQSPMYLVCRLLLEKKKKKKEDILGRKRERGLHGENARSQRQ